MTNKFDGSEDYLVSDRLYELVGQEMLEFRNSLMAEERPKNLQALIKTITPPKGVKRK